MNDDKDNEFRPRVRARRRSTPSSHILSSRVAKLIARNGGRPRSKGIERRTLPRSGSARLGRGSYVAHTLTNSYGDRSRRVMVKTRLVVLARVSATSMAVHLRYIQRDGIGPEGERSRLYGPHKDQVSATDFEKRSARDRHQFRIIVSPEDGARLRDLRQYTRQFMQDMERDLGTRLEWVAVDHWDTDNPHTHIVLRGRDQQGCDLVIDRDYIAYGMRKRAAEVVNMMLGPRRELEIIRAQAREPDLERWTSLDEALALRSADGIVDVSDRPANVGGSSYRALLARRLTRLQSLGLAKEVESGRWVMPPDVERKLRALGERGDIVRTMQRAFTSQRKDYLIFSPTGAATTTGRVVAKGVAHELDDRGYLILDGTDGSAHYVTLASKVDLGSLPIGAIVSVRGTDEPRRADQTIVRFTRDGLYETARHLEVARAKKKRGVDPNEYVHAHVRRLEALRRAGVVERVTEGVWRIPADFVARGRAYDSGRLDGANVEVRSYVPLQKQVSAMAATWLDQMLLERSDGQSLLGFGAEVHAALRQRGTFLVEQGLAQRHGDQWIPAPNLLATLRARELRSAAQAISDETGLNYREPANGESVTGVYRRSVILASGHFAMLDDGLGFVLVPWRPVVEEHLGHSAKATINGQGVSWTLGWRRGLSL